ncbi:MAG: hypothetical protein ABSH20_21405 [Tepidisphaeraceae bacterium]|jgi:hypothetical protein
MKILTPAFRIALIVLTITAMLATQACTQTEVLTTLEASVTATEAVVTALSIAGKIDPNTAGLIESAIADLPDAYSQTATELASSDSPAVKAAKIAGYYAATVSKLNALPPQAQLWASAISAAIQTFLETLGPASTAATVGAARAGTPFVIHWYSFSARASLDKVKARAAKLKTSLNTLPAASTRAKK